MGPAMHTYVSQEASDRALRSPLRILVGALAIASALGCAGPKASARDVNIEGPKVADTKSPKAAAPSKPADAGPVETERIPEVKARAKLAFEDALKEYQKQAAVGRVDCATILRKFQAASDADETFGEPDYNMGVVAERWCGPDGKKQAEQHYKNALRKKPTLKQAAENLAVIELNKGNEEGAIAILQKILEQYPEDASSRARLAELYRRRGELERSIELARESLFRDPKTLTAYKVMMQAYYDLKQLSLAKLVALRALKLDENDPVIHHTLGLIHLAENEPVKARLNFKKAVEVRPDYLPAHLLLGKMALEQDDFLGAEQSWSAILRANGNNPEAHVNLGVAYKGQGQYDKAMQEYDIAQKLNPNLPAIYLNKGILIAIKGEPEKAIDHFKKYIEMNGTSEAVHKLIQEQEAVIQKREEEKRALEEAKRMEEEMKRQEEAAKAEEKKKADEELRRRQEEAKGKRGDKPAADPVKQKCLENAKTAKQRADCERGGASPVAPAEQAAKRNGTPEEPKKPAVQPTSTRQTGEPGEPDDGL